MSTRAKAMQRLYRMGRVTEAALRKACQDGILTREELIEILSSGSNKK